MEPGNDHVLYSKNSLFHVFVKGLFQVSMLVFKVWSLENAETINTISQNATKLVGPFCFVKLWAKSQEPWFAGWSPLPRKDFDKNHNENQQITTLPNWNYKTKRNGTWRKHLACFGGGVFSFMQLGPCQGHAYSYHEVFSNSLRSIEDLEGRRESFFR